MYDYLSHIHSQLRQREITPQFQQFRYLPMDTIKTRYEISAYNELVFLPRLSGLPPGTRIISDSRIREIPPDVGIIEAVEDYSGLVVIELSGPLGADLTFEFIQITL